MVRFQSAGMVEHWIQETNRERFGIIAGHLFAARHLDARFDVVEGPEYNAENSPYRLSGASLVSLPR
jgi:hypothetical protein